MEHQDWTPVTFKGPTKGNRTKAEQIAQAKREGNVAIERKCEYLIRFRHYYDQS